MIIETKDNIGGMRRKLQQCDYELDLVTKSLTKNRKDRKKPDYSTAEDHATIFVNYLDSRVTYACIDLYQNQSFYIKHCCTVRNYLL